MHAGDADRTVDQQIDDKVKGIVNIVKGAGTTKKLKFPDFLKRCPAKWSKDCTTRNMNLAAFGYASIAELEAGLSGKSESFSHTELLARVRHIKSVFEVCCLNSADSDFKSYGWILARDYACKVTNRVDQELATWVEMTPGVQTADLVSAQCDYPRPPPKFERKGAVKEDDPRQKRLCTTYNTCSTENKCDYEVANPGRECLRKHECTYCRKHLRQGLRHQEGKCRKKEAAGH